MLIRLRSICGALFVLASSATLTVACDDDEEGEEEHGHEEPAVCKEISSVCHDADTMPGMAQDCHTQAHEGDAEVCEMIHDECIAFCTGAGTGESSGSSSSG